MSILNHARLQVKQLVAFLRDIYRIFRPTFEEARAQYEAPRTPRSRVSSRASSILTAVSCVKQASGTLDQPNFEAAHRLYVENCDRYWDDSPYEDSSRVIRILQRWQDEDHRQTRGVIENWGRGREEVHAS